MNLRRRMILQSAAVALSVPTSCFAATPVCGAANLMGFGRAGKNLILQYAETYPARGRQDYLSFDNREVVGITHRVARESISLSREPNAGPLIVAAGLGRTAGALAYDVASEWIRDRRSPVHGVFVLPFRFEGRRRSDGLAQAARFVETFGTAHFIDNEDYFWRDGESLLDIYQRANAFASTRMMALVASGYRT